MNLKDVTEKLVVADENLATALIKLMPLEMKYQSRLDELQLSSQQGNQFQREAEARKIIMYEPIYEEYQTAKLDTKLAYIRLDTLKETCKNLRNLAFDQT